MDPRLNRTPRRQRVDRDLVRYLSLLAGREPAGALIEIRYRVATGPRMRQHWCPATRPAAAAREIRELAEHTDVYVGVAPRRGRHGGKAAIRQVWLLWADVDDPAAQGLADDLATPPGIVIASGSPGHHHLYWPLTSPLTVERAEHANQVLAQAVHGDTGAVLNAATILRPPGTRSFKTDPPALVTLERLDARAHPASEILCGLPAAPAPPPATVQPRRAPAADPLLRIEPAAYVQALTGLTVPRGRKVSCPFHADRTPSLHVYPEPSDGWHCYGCGRGGSIYDLASALWHLETRGDEFLEIRERLTAQLLPRTPQRR
jgi:hypothetical protein